MSLSTSSYYYGDSVSTRCGHVRVYTYNDDTPGWEQRGEDINGDFRNPIQSGWSVALSGDGEVVAVGARGPQYYSLASEPEYVTVNYWNDNKWVQRGTDMYGNSPLDYYGKSTALSSDGNTVAAGAYAGESPYVRVLRWNGTNWNPLGGGIHGDGGADLFGWSVSLDHSGQTIAIGAPHNGGTRAGRVRVYRFQGGAWTIVGGNIDGVEDGSESGYSVSLSDDEDYVVVGAHSGGDQALLRSGQTRVYTLTNDAWVQVGQAINGENRFERSGTSVSYLRYSIGVDELNHLVAIGAPSSYITLFGRVRVYRLDGNVWYKIGGDIVGADAGDRTGTSVSMKYSASQGKTMLAVGTPYSDDSRGHVQVYAFAATGWSKVGPSLDGEESGDYSGISVSLSSNGETLAVGAYKNDCEYPPPSLPTPRFPPPSPSPPPTPPPLYPPAPPYDDRVSTLCGHVRVYTYSDDNQIWAQRGEDINGDFRNPIQSGWSVSLSGDGEVVAVGVRGPEVWQTADEPEYVTVNYWDDNKWIQRGTHIYGNSPVEYFGWVIALSKYGTTMAIGAPLADPPHVRVLRWNGKNWNPLGGNIYGDGGPDKFGWSVSLGAYGEDLAIGAPSHGRAGSPSEGLVRVYRLNVGGVWEQRGSDIYGGVSYGESGHSVSIHHLGQYLVIGAPKLNARKGQTRLYKFTNNEWDTLGSDIKGQHQYEESGFSVSYILYSYQFEIRHFVAIGAPGSGKGYARVYQLDESALNAGWSQVGDDIVGQSEDDKNGVSVYITNFISESTTTRETFLAVGANRHDGYKGNARVYILNGEVWDQMGQDLDGEESGDYSGTSVSLSSNGKTLAVGAYKNDCEYPTELLV